MTYLAKRFGDRTTVMMECGIRTGPDVALRGAQFTFLGRSFMYGVGAWGRVKGFTPRMVK